MSKYIIFLLLILSIISKDPTNAEEQDLYKSIYDLTMKTKTNIIQNYREKIESLNEEESTLGYPSLADQIGRKSGFESKSNDILEIKVFTSEDSAKNSIVDYVVKYKIRNTGVHDLGNFFNLDIKYDVQWSKYDLLVCQSKDIRTLSVFTKKYGSKYVNVYFVTINRVKYRYNDFILINKSENTNNPFNNFYLMQAYKYDYSFFKALKDSYKIVTEKDDPNVHKYKEVLVKYYSILSYKMIAEKLTENYRLPFE